MLNSKNYFTAKKELAHRFFTEQKELYNPYFKTKIILNSEGFHHLQFSGRKERTKQEQLLKFSFLNDALEIITKSSTIQEYRKLLITYGKNRNGTRFMKLAEYWGMVAITSRNKKVRVVLRKVGDGNIIFWSVMPVGKTKEGKQKLFLNGIEDE